MTQPPPWPPYPHPPRTGMPGWAWGLIGAVVGGAVAFLAMTVVPLLLFGFFAFMFAEDLGVDDEYWVEDPAVIAATREPCRAMMAAGEAIPVFEGPAAAAAALTTYAESLTAIATAADTTGTDDAAALAWRDDLRELAALVESTAEEVAGGNGSTDIDLGGVSGLSDRVTEGAPGDCAIPARVSNLDQRANTW